MFHAINGDSNRKTALPSASRDSHFSTVALSGSTVTTFIAWNTWRAEIRREISAGMEKQSIKLYVLLSALAASVQTYRE